MLPAGPADPAPIGTAAAVAAFDGGAFVFPASVDAGSGGDAGGAASASACQNAAAWFSSLLASVSVVPEGEISGGPAASSACCWSSVAAAKILVPAPKEGSPGCCAAQSCSCLALELDASGWVDCGCWPIGKAGATGLENAAGLPDVAVADARRSSSAMRLFRLSALSYTGL